MKIKDKLKILLQLYLTFFKIGIVTFGGGLSQFPILERELADRKKWVTSDDILDYYAISQSTPGVVAVNVAEIVGYKMAGVMGSVVSLLAAVTPSIIIITIIANLISAFDQIEWIQKAMKGINVSVAALLTYSVIKFARKTVKNWWGIILFSAAFILVFFLNVSTIWVILGSASIGLIFGIINILRNKKKLKAAAENNHQPEKDKNDAD